VRIAPVIIACALVAGGAGTACAQLVHLTLFSSDANGIMNSNDPASPWAPWELRGPVQLDVYYDPTQLPTSVNPEGPDTFAGNPADNFWTLTFGNGPPPHPNFSITRPLSFETLGNGIEINFQQNPGDPDPLDDFFSATITFDASGLSDPFGVPIPPFGNLIDSSFNMFGREDLFGVPDQADANFGGDLDSFSAAIVPDFEPVPEPSTYGLAAAGIICLAVAARRTGNRRLMA
jgi:hypothetical protein